MVRKSEQGGAELRADLSAAAKRLGSRLRHPDQLAPVTEWLREGEGVRFVVLGTYERSGGALVVTDVRALFFYRGAQEPTLDQWLGGITSVTTSSGALTGEVALEVGEAVHAVSRIVKSDLEPVAHALRQAIAAGPAEPEPKPTDERGKVDPFEAMEKLAALRDSGVLTEAEFVAKKQELLDRL